MRWGLRYQLLLPPALLLLGVAGITTWTATASANRARRQLETRMRHVAEALGGFPLIPSVLDRMRLLSGAEFIFIDNNGKRISTLSSEPVELPVPSEHYDDPQALL